MGELSQQIGKKLEGYANSFFENLNWKVLSCNVEIECSRKNHKSANGTTEKRTHGIDILAGFYNPLSGMNEAVIIECKNRKWKDFTAGNLNKWIEELVNTIECASVTESVTTLLDNHILTTGILLFNSSDGIYDPQKAKECVEQIQTPKKKNPLLLYLADPSMLDRWDALAQEVNKIKTKSIPSSFSIIYPSISGSKWERIDQLTPMYMFSDYILSTYTFEKDSIHTNEFDAKSIFCFDKIGEDCFAYINDMISKLQLEAKGVNELVFEIYLYPKNGKEISDAVEIFDRSDLVKRHKIELKFLKNRNIPPVEYGKWSD